MQIQFEHVTRQFNGYTAVDDVSFTIGQGEIVGLLGHNGAGKTTIMKLLTGYLELTSGDIIVDGLHIGSDKQFIQTCVGYLPENCPLWSDMSVIDFLSYQVSLQGVPKAAQDLQIANAIQRTQLMDKATQSIHTLSKGYRQRVGVANAILKNPKIIILDEPTNGIDPMQTLHMRALIQELAKNSTVILSTHILQEVQAICSRVIILRAGKLVTDEKLSELDRAKGLRITVDQDESAVRLLLKDLIGMRSIRLNGVKDKQYQYLLDTCVDAAPLISQKIHQAGFQLYELTVEKQSLESLFKEDFTVQSNTKCKLEDIA